MSRLKDLINQDFDCWKVIRRVGNSPAGKARWLCECVCGNRRKIVGSDLRSGKSTNCGCDHYRKVQQFLTGRLRSQEMRDKISGEKHYNWKGGISSKRKLPEYREWRSQVFERDSYTCQKCGIRGGTLNAHHIVAYKDSPSLRIEIDNGVTLCYDCHRDFHHQYGNDCTGKQLNKFMEGT